MIPVFHDYSLEPKITKCSKPPVSGFFSFVVSRGQQEFITWLLGDAPKLSIRISLSFYTTWVGTHSFVIPLKVFWALIPFWCIPAASLGRENSSTTRDTKKQLCAMFEFLRFLDFLRYILAILFITNHCWIITVIKNIILKLNTYENVVGWKNSSIG